jgi:hypothetical protein
MPCRDRAESYTQRLVRVLGGLHPRDPRGAAHGLCTRITGLEYDAADVEEAADAVKAIAFAVVALDLEAERGTDALCGWLLAPEHTSLPLRTPEGIGALTRVYFAQQRYLRGRIRSGSVVPGGMRNPETFERMKELADAGVPHRAFVELCATLLVPIEAGALIAYNDNGQKRRRARCSTGSSVAAKPGLRRAH